MRMIFHVPRPVKQGKQAGFHVRVANMYQAFCNIGYTVDFISGYGSERKDKIEAVRKNIEDGVKYDFLYAENATIPTELTETHHLPFFLGLDFKFFRVCKRAGIPSAVFYRDIYWRFPEYKQKVGLLKRIFMNLFHFRDLHAYRHYFDILYVPSTPMYEYMPFTFKGSVQALPPGITADKSITKDEINGLYEVKKRLSILYVGGISSFYNLELLFKVAHQLDKISLTVCCREADWEQNKHLYEPYLNSRIHVVHKSGDELVPLYQQADIGALFLEPSEWRSFAMPIKLFEYIQYGKPIIATQGTSAGDFVEQNRLGWVIDYSENALTAILNTLQSHPEELRNKIETIVKMRTEHTWKNRAEQVAEELTTEKQGKIGIFTRPIDQATSGSGHHLLEIVRHLLMQNHSYKIVFIHYEKNSNPIYAHAQELLIPRNPVKAAHLIQREGFDVLHYSPLTMFSPVLGIKAKKVATIHGAASLFIPGKMGLKKWLHDSVIRPWLLKKMDAVITVSQTSRDYFVKSHNIPKDKFTVCYNAVSPKYKVLSREAIKEIPYTNKHFFFHISKFSLRKNPWTILKAFQLYVNSYGGTEDMVIAGSGWDNTQIKDFLQIHNLVERVHLTGFIDEMELISLYNKAEIFIFPSLYEGFGMPNLEAMACGCPVITSSAFAIPEVVGRAAKILKNMYDEKELAQTMYLLQQNPSVKEELKKAGLEQVRKFSWENSADAVLNVYADLVKKS